MARESGAARTVRLGGLELSFQRNDPEKPGRKMGERKLAALRVAKLDRESDESTGTSVNEFKDRVLYGPSSLTGVVSDFAAVAEVTVRRLQLSRPDVGSACDRMP
jgi:hypothetical protein